MRAKFGTRVARGVTDTEGQVFRPRGAPRADFTGCGRKRSP